MSVMQGVLDNRVNEILQESVRNTIPVMLTQRTSQGWRMFKGRFASNDLTTRTVVVQAQPAGSPCNVPLSAGETVGITFRVGHRKCMGSAVLRSIKPIAGGFALTLQWPDQLQQLQRRVFERAKPPRGAVIAVRFWQEEAGTETAATDRVVKHGQLEDLSAGGMRIKAADTADVILDANYRCVFTPRQGAPAFVLDATLRHREAGDRGRLALGFQFIGLETSPEGRKTLERLARLVSQYHRASGRRKHDKNSEGEPQS